MEIKITFPGREKVNAELNGRIIPTDQPVEAGGEGSARSTFPPVFQRNTAMPS